MVVNFLKVGEPSLNPRTHDSKSHQFLLADDNSYTLSVTNVAVDIRDQYLVEVVADYTIIVDTETIESGKMVLTMIGTPSAGWKISAGALTY